jgi:hypothetical protein
VEASAIRGLRAWHDARVSSKRTTASKPARSPLKTPARAPRPSAKKTTARSAATKKVAGANAPRGSAARTTSTKKAMGRASPSRPVARRADFGAPVAGFIAKQSPERRALLEKLRHLVETAAPDAEGALKWGMPMFTIGGRMMCGLGAHKAHVNLILAGRPEMFADPEGRLEGEGKTGRRLVLRQLSDLPEKSVRSWLEAAADNARRG